MLLLYPPIACLDDFHVEAGGGGVNQENKSKRQPQNKETV